MGSIGDSFFILSFLFLIFLLKLFKGFDKSNPGPFEEIFEFFFCYHVISLEQFYIFGYHRDSEMFIFF